MVATNNARKGRPAEQTEDGELNKRRERGRMAQQAFRQRQVDTITMLEGEVASLNRTLDDIAALVYQLNGNILTESTSAASVPVRRTMDRLLEKLEDKVQEPKERDETTILVGRDASDTSFPLQGRGDQNSTSETLSISLPDNPQPPPTAANTEPRAMAPISSDPYDLQLNFSDSTSIFKQSPGSGSRHGRLSPRLDYGLWLEPDPGLPIVVPPEDIIPFLSDVESPFVFKLYWSTISLALSVLCDHWRRSASTPKFALRLAQNIFGRSLQYNSSETLVASLDARLGFRLRGQIEATHPGRDPSKATRLHHKIQDEMKARGETMQNWLDAWEVERLIGTMYGPGQVHLLQATSSESADAFGAQITNRLVERLARQSVCFGDGPRYFAGTVATTVQLVLSDIFPEVVHANSIT